MTDKKILIIPIISFLTCLILAFSIVFFIEYIDLISFVVFIIDAIVISILGKIKKT